jgi:hypothetical protein
MAAPLQDIVSTRQLSGDTGPGTTSKKRRILGKTGAGALGAKDIEALDFEETETEKKGRAAGRVGGQIREQELENERVARQAADEAAVSTARRAALTAGARTAKSRRQRQNVRTPFFAPLTSEPKTLLGQ